MLPSVPSFMDLFEPDKLVHFFIFGILTILVFRSLARDIQRSLRKAVLIALLLSIFYGALTEILQVYFFINRQGSIYDFIANSLGSIIACLLCMRWRALLPVRNKDEVE